MYGGRNAVQSRDSTHAGAQTCLICCISLPRLIFRHPHTQDLASLTTASEKAAMFVDVGRIICKCVARHKDALNGGDSMNCNEEMTV